MASNIRQSVEKTWPTDCGVVLCLLHRSPHWQVGGLTKGWPGKQPSGLFKNGGMPPKYSNWINSLVLARWKAAVLRAWGSERPYTIKSQYSILSTALLRQLHANIILSPSMVII